MTKHLEMFPITVPIKCSFSIIKLSVEKRKKNCLWSSKLLFLLKFCVFHDQKEDVNTKEILGEKIVRKNFQYRLKLHINYF